MPDSTLYLIEDLTERGVPSLTKFSEERMLNRKAVWGPGLSQPAAGAGAQAVFASSVFMRSRIM